jgi:hypothetical protein
VTETDWAKYPQAMLAVKAKEMLLEQALGEEFTTALREMRQALVCCERCYGMGHERTEDGSSDGGSGTTESDGHPED